MTKKRKKGLRHIISLALTAALLTGMPALEVNAAAEDGSLDQKVEVLEAEVTVLETAAPVTRTMISSRFIDVGTDSQGMVITITTAVTKKASVVGVKDVKIYKKVWYGWKEVATSDGGEALDCVSMNVKIHYTNAEIGETYKITCVHYGDVDGYTEEPGDSGSFKYQ